MPPIEQGIFNAAWDSLTIMDDTPFTVGCLLANAICFVVFLFLLYKVTQTIHVNYLSIWGVLWQKQVSRSGPSNYITQILWDVIICPDSWYLLPPQHSWYIFFWVSTLVPWQFHDCYNASEVILKFNWYWCCVTTTATTATKRKSRCLLFVHFCCSWSTRLYLKFVYI